MNIQRHYQKLESHLSSDKVLILYGPRQVGKTTLLQTYIKQHPQQKIKLVHGQDIEVEEQGGKLHGFEFKWGKKTPRASSKWLETYAEASFKMINRNNYLDFVT